MLELHECVQILLAEHAFVSQRRQLIWLLVQPSHPDFLLREVFPQDLVDLAPRFWIVLIQVQVALDPVQIIKQMDEFRFSLIVAADVLWTQTAQARRNFQHGAQGVSFLTLYFYAIWEVFGPHELVIGSVLLQSRQAALLFF